MAAAIIILAVLLVASTGYSLQHIVGGNQGWSLSGDYESWASQQSFVVGDTLVFNYTSTHGVIVVGKAAYDSCDSSNPAESHMGGRSTIVLSRPGPMYFICPALGQCAAGMKLAIVVSATSNTPSPSVGSKRGKGRNLVVLILGPIALVLICAFLVWYCCGRREVRQVGATNQLQNRPERPLELVERSHEREVAEPEIARGRAPESAQRRTSQKERERPPEGAIAKEPERALKKERGKQPEGAIAKEPERAPQKERGKPPKGAIAKEPERAPQKERGKPPEGALEKERGKQPEGAIAKEPERAPQKERGKPPKGAIAKEPERAPQKERGKPLERAIEKEPERALKLAPENAGERAMVESRRTQFTYNEIKKITKKFGTLLGEGGFGEVYLGCLDGKQVAVKVLSESSRQGYQQFEAEVEILLRVHHRNLTSLVGYCYEDNKMGLIYEYMDNGDLKRLLGENDRTIRSWQSRLEIALDAAQGLEYLHHHCSPPIVHRDVKSTNILLNNRFQAKLADFGLSRVFPTESRTHVSTVPAGTPGYLDVDYWGSHRLTKKSDVYSFGVLLLEIITRQPVTQGSDPSNHIINRVRSMLGKANADIRQIIDRSLLGGYDINSAKKTVDLAMSCVHVRPDERPDMIRVVGELRDCLQIEKDRKTRSATV